MSDLSDFRCPCCGGMIRVSVVPQSNTIYDSSDPVQKQGFDDQTWNDEHPFPLPTGMKYKQNPHPDKSDAYYRWNLGARHTMK